MTEKTDGKSGWDDEVVTVTEIPVLPCVVRRSFHCGETRHAHISDFPLG